MKLGQRGLHNQLVHELGQLIVSGDPMIQQLVPSEIEEKYEVSRTVVREVIRVLQSKGMVSATPNRGTHVRPISDWNALDPDIIEWRSRSPDRDNQHRELRELHRLIETYAARQTAYQARRKTWRQLSNAVEQMQGAVHQNQASEFSLADARFHQLLARDTDSRILNHLSAIVSKALQTCASSKCEQSEASVERHEAVVDAIWLRDSDLAESTMHDLLTNRWEAQTAGIASVDS